MCKNTDTNFLGFNLFFFAYQDLRRQDNKYTKFVNTLYKYKNCVAAFILHHMSIVVKAKYINIKK